MNFIWFVVAVFAFISISRLQDRISRLEEKLKNMGLSPKPIAEPSSIAPMAASPTPAPLPAITPAPDMPTEPVVPQGPTPGDEFIAWLKEDWLLKLGALLLLMGVGWFIAYAFSNNWIGPAGRIGLGLGLGVLAILLGAARMKNYMHQGEVFVVAGGTTILLTLYAARSVYDFFTPAAVLVAMFLTAGAVAVTSVVRESAPLALSSLLMALAAPLFVGSVEPDYVGLFAYLIAVLLGTLWVVAARKQRALIVVALLGVWWYSLGGLLYISHIPTAVHTILYVLVAVMALIFFIASLTNYSRTTSANGGGDSLDIITAIGVGLLVWAWGGALLVHDLQATVLFGWSLIFVLGALYTYLLTKRPEPLYAFGGVGAILLGVASSIQWGGHTLGVAWTLEAAALTIGTLLITKHPRPASIASITFIAPLLHSVNYFHFFAQPHYDDAFVLALIAAALLAAGTLLSFSWQGERADDAAPGALLIFGVIYLFVASATLWQGAPLTIVWTLIATGVVLVVYGVSQQRSLAYLAAIAFFLPAIRSFEHIGASSWDTGILHLDALALLVLGTALLAVGVLLRKEQGNAQSLHAEADPAFVIATFGSFYYAAVLWLAAPTLFGKDYAVMSALVIYTVVGLGCYLTGRAGRHTERTVYGGGLLAFVVLRLLLVDVWQMELSGRIVTFLIIGTLLTTTAFIGRAPKTSNTPPTA